MRCWIRVVLFTLAAAAGDGLLDDAASRALAQEGTAAKSATSDSSVQLLSSVRTLIQQRRYREASRLLLERLQRGSADRLELLEGTLGEVYFCSGEYDKAEQCLTRSMARYERASATLELLKEQGDVAGLLSDAYARQGNGRDAIATLEQMYARYDHENLVNPAVQMGIVDQLAALGATGLGAANSAVPLDREMAWLSQRLEADRDRVGVADDNYMEGITSLAQYQWHRKRFAQAASTLEQFIAWCDARRYALESISLRLQLAQVYRELKDSGKEIATLEAALRLQQEQRPASAAAGASGIGGRIKQLYDVAELERRLTDAMFRGGRRRQGFELLESAVQDYLSAREQVRLRPADDESRGEISDLLLLERLVGIGERLLGSERPGNVSLRDSIRWHEELVTHYGQSALANDPRIGRLNVSMAGLYLENSQFDLVRAKLALARQYWSQRRPLDVSMLVQTLTLVGESDLATASQNALREAADALVEAGKLCNALPADDELRWWVRLNLGRLKAAQGHYRLALDELEQIAGAQSDRNLSPKLRSMAMLYLGLLYKEQLQLDEALKLCRQALDLRHAELSFDDPERLRYYSALAELYIARYDVAQHDDRSLEEMLTAAEKACSRLSQDHPSRATLRHQQAMLHYMQDDQSSSAAERQSARVIWEQLAATCQRTGQGAMQARALHYLARLDYLDWTAEAKAWIGRLHSEKAGEEEAAFTALRTRITKFNERQHQLDHARLQYRQAKDSYDRSAGEPFEVREAAFRGLQDRYQAIEREQKSLSEMAVVLRQERVDLLKAHDAAVARRSALEIADRKRWNNLLNHGETLAQQALALLRAACIYPSLHHAVLCNQAQLLQAQSQLGGDRNQLLERAIAALQEAAELIEDPRAAVFTGDFLRAEFFTQYQSAFDLQVQFLVQAGRPAQALVAAEQGRARTLLDQLWPEKFAHSFPAQRAAELVEQCRVSDQPLLYFYVGDAASYLFVLGGSRHEIQVFPLKAAGAGVFGADANASHTYIAGLVGRLVNTLRDDRNARQLLKDPRATENFASASAELLPPAVATYLEQELIRGAGWTTVIPHEAISQLPLEALLVGSAQARSYLVDHCPPIVYAPSLMVLDDLEHDRLSSSAPPRLLTVGNPEYRLSGSQLAGSGSSGQQGFVPLPATESECRAIARSYAQRFGAGSVTVLTQSAASESGFRAACQERPITFLHLAAHGVAGNECGQPFGRIVLSPPASPAHPKSEDGFFDLEEIRALNLSVCELAVLSSCNTNLGATVRRQYNNRRSNESGSIASHNQATLHLSQTDTCFSLAAAFLAAGSRRVLATQWEVADPSTSDLMVSYFDKLMRELSANRPVNYARLLADARKEMRSSHPEFNSPFHWAPFVLIGPPQTLGHDGHSEAAPPTIQ